MCDKSMERGETKTMSMKWEGRQVVVLFIFFSLVIDWIAFEWFCKAPTLKLKITEVIMMLERTKLVTLLLFNIFDEVVAF